MPLVRKRLMKRKRNGKKGKALAKFNAPSTQLAIKHAKSLWDKIERRRINKSAFAQAISTTGLLINNILTPVPGDGVGDRQGRKITATYIRMNFVLMRQAATNNRVRVIVAFLNNGNGNNAVLTNMLQAVSAATNEVTILSQYHQDRLSEYSVLLDRVYTLNTNAANSQRVIRLAFPLGNTNVRFNGGAVGNYGDVDDKLLHVFFIGNDITVANYPLVDYDIRTYYQDL